MKLIKMRILSFITGLLTLSGLVMLFLGLCNQMDKADHFLIDEQLVSWSDYANSTIFMAVLAVVIFGVLFFATWAKARRVEAHVVRHHSHHAHA